MITDWVNRLADWQDERHFKKLESKGLDPWRHSRDSLPTSGLGIVCVIAFMLFIIWLAGA